MNAVTGRRGDVAKGVATEIATRKKRNTRKKGPGRPEGTSIVRETILNAAEDIFANLGYAGTTLREVANEANVTQALINYYFGSKYGLFEEVFLRRSQVIADARTENLAALQALSSAPSVRDIVQAFLTPTLAFRATPEGRSFLRLQARLHTEPPQISYQLRTNAYGTSTRDYVNALRAALPHLSELDATWRVTFMVGTYLYAFSDTHRMEEMIPEGMYDPEDTTDLIEQVTRFVTAGLLAA